MNTGDTAWVMLSTILVFAMTIPGLAFFYGGLVRRKNVLSVLMQCFIIMCVISLQWVLFGYSLSFGADTGQGIIGGLDLASVDDSLANFMLVCTTELNSQAGIDRMVSALAEVATR